MKKNLTRVSALLLCLGMGMGVSGCGALAAKSDESACKGFAEAVKEQADKVGHKRPDNLQEALKLLSPLAEPAKRASERAASEELTKDFKALSDSFGTDFTQKPEAMLTMGLQIESVTQQCKDVGVDFSKIK